MIDPKLKAINRIYRDLPEERKELMREFILPDEVHAQELENIKKAYYTGKKVSDKPKFVIVLGQTGSGKTNLTSYILKGNPNLVVIDSDKYKEFRPDVHRIQKFYPVEFAYLTAPDAYQHRDEMIYDAMSKKYDILMECATSMKDGMFVDIDRIIEAGYTVELAVLAVSQLNSLLSIHERYEAQLMVGYQAAKLTDTSRHDDSFTSLQKVISSVQNKNIQISIYERGKSKMDSPVLIYSSEQQGQRYSSPLEALIFVQANDEKRALKEFDKRYLLLQTQMFTREAPIEQTRQLEEIRDRYMKFKSRGIEL